jgi:hypothetical protein
MTRLLRVVLGLDAAEAPAAGELLYSRVAHSARVALALPSVVGSRMAQRNTGRSRDSESVGDTATARLR